MVCTGEFADQLMLPNPANHQLMKGNYQSCSFIRTSSGTGEKESQKMNLKEETEPLTISEEFPSGEPVAGYHRKGKTGNVSSCESLTTCKSTFQLTVKIYRVDSRTLAGFWSSGFRSEGRSQPARQPQPIMPRTTRLTHPMDYSFSLSTRNRPCIIFKGITYARPHVSPAASSISPLLSLPHSLRGSTTAHAFYSLLLSKGARQLYKLRTSSTTSSRDALGGRRWGRRRRRNV